MRIITLSLLLCGLVIQSFGVRPPLKGYTYASEQAPTGKEWQSPENLALNKEQPHAWFFPFQDIKSARKVLPENSIYWQSLNGNWKFNWAADPDSRPKDFYKTDFDVTAWDNIPVPSSWNIYGVQQDGSLKYGVPIYVNQPVIFMHSVKADDWRGGVMRTPPTNWTTYKYRNEVGSFRREFEIPEHWDGREVFISFDGVDSFFYLWINGMYVGFSKNSRNTANFNITNYLRSGKNIVAAEVYRNSDGSFLEAQDMFRLPGIFRTVALYSTPKVQIRDLVATPDLDNNYTDGSLTIQADIRNFGKKTAKGYKVCYSLYANKLYSDENEPVILARDTKGAAIRNSVVAQVEPITTGNTQEAEKVVLKVKNPNKWSAETPYRYTLIAELKGVDAGRIFIGNGSDEAIDLCYRIFCRPGVDNAVSIAPTYGMYRVAADINDVEMREVPLGADFSLPTDALLAAADERTRLLWLCSPNNPTGNAFPAAGIERLLREFDGMVVLDEAYIDFAAGPGFLARLGEFGNLIVLQTLSKAWGMAGLRLGLAFASEAVAGLFARVKYPYNINSLAQQAVAERLTEDISPQVAEIRAERDRAKQDAALARMESGLRQYEAENKTGNPVLDTLLTAKTMECQQENITITSVADGRMLGFLTIRELCTIVGVALDNAIAAVRAEPDPEKRLVKVAVYSQGGFAMLRFEHYTEAAPALDADGLPQQGSDLKSVRTTVGQHGGSMTMHWENNWCTLRILFPLPQKQ